VPLNKCRTQAAHSATLFSVSFFRSCCLSWLLPVCQPLSSAAATIIDLGNVLLLRMLVLLLRMVAMAVFVGSYLLTASAGPAFPESYEHNDGGTYRGEWRSLAKEGLGVYRSESSTVTWQTAVGAELCVLLVVDTEAERLRYPAMPVMQCSCCCC